MMATNKPLLVIYGWLLLILMHIEKLSSVSVSLDGIWNVRNSNKSISIPSQVPGGIYTDLMRAKIIGDPYFRYNDVLCQWIGREDWEFSRTFDLSDEMLSRKRISLVAYGLDTVGDVFINDQLVGKSTNMFIRYNFDIKPHLKISDNSVRISFKSPVKYAKSKSEKYVQQYGYIIPPVCPSPIQSGECHVNFIRKIQSSFSWDWGPSFPSSGIWKNISIEAYDTTVIRDVTVNTIATSLSNGTYNWSLNITTYYELATLAPVTGNLTIMLNEDIIFHKEVIFQSNGSLEGNISILIKIPDDYPIKLWWPNGYGDQILYNISVLFHSVSSSEETSKNIRFGFRLVDLVQEKIEGSSGLSFYFRINGVKIFAKGSNWIPADSFPERITEDYLHELLQSTKDANMNMLRVWGGGMYETDSFYNIADELGILIWQDIMFAVALYPTDEEFLESVSIEVQQQVIKIKREKDVPFECVHVWSEEAVHIQMINRLQHHPSIVIWAGNNENEVGLAQHWWIVTVLDMKKYKNDYIKLYIDTIMPIVIQDSSRPFVSSSPSNGKKTKQDGWLSSNPQDNKYGDVHFYDYTMDSWNWTNYPRARFVSEYGFQSYPSFETLAKVSLPEDWKYPISNFILHREHSFLGGLEIIKSISNHLFSPKIRCGVDAFKDFLYLSQITQAMSIKTETEFYRRGQSEIVNSEGMTMGALYWQLNDIWQAPSWSSIEFGGKWKILHYFAVKFFDEFLVSPYKDGENITVAFVSDKTQSYSNLHLILTVHHWSSLNTSYEQNITFSQKPQSSKIVFSILQEELLNKSNCKTSEECVLSFHVVNEKGNQLGSPNNLFLSIFNKAKGLQKANITIDDVHLTSMASGDQTYTISLTTDRIAPFVWLDTEVKGQFSDNGFLFITPKLKIKFKTKQNIPTEELKQKITIRSLMDVCNQ